GVNEFWGGWSRASGYLKFVLKRKDINGLIGPINSSNYYNFDDHFDPKTRGYRKRYYMSGLSMDKPVFFFIMDKEKKELKQLEYALQWRGKT
ncbi:MAG: hypothetical protein GTO45_17590, partial [Candidatus Aminicenantes bacterium]|nr:hypothetical protein [Candidatus Aminicenantes bacterium]NIM80563.1 hypothetical protein [Candidatus Aminicenantes bacterium]NIN19944.1 hypothetical protein [Candidatus Aminicenantes bacterium]NIN43792.1 hypothetical protein [Candidatus Aminicenantes bacterium]NIN86570.1 hypothetical protein [Candidatus Aminicenantes bacterium]